MKGPHNLLFFQTESPSGDELTLLGAYLLISLIFVFFTVAEFAVLLILKEVHEQGLHRTGLTMDDSISGMVLSKYVTRRQNTAVQVSELEKINDDLKNDVVNEQRRTMSHIITPKLFQTLPLIRKIDFSSFFLYHFTYVLFNFMYWFICCNLDA